MKIGLNPKKIFIGLLGIIFFLLFVHIFLKIFTFYSNHGDWTASLFDFNGEMNIPAIYSFMTLFLCSILLSILSVIQKIKVQSYLPWLGLAVCFLFISIDEIAQIHECINIPIREELNLSGPFFFSWIIPYGLGVIVLLLMYLRFLFRLPKRILILFIVSGVIYILGAIGFEILEGMEYDLNGDYYSVQFCVLYTIEEFLEMLGVATFLYSLLLYISIEFNYVTVIVLDR